MVPIFFSYGRLKGYIYIYNTYLFILRSCTLNWSYDSWWDTRTTQESTSESYMFYVLIKCKPIWFGGLRSAPAGHHDQDKRACVIERWTTRRFENYFSI